MRYRNVYRFSAEVEETRHDGHKLISVSDPYALDADPEALGRDVTCECGESFLAFDGEVVQA